MKTLYEQALDAALTGEGFGARHPEPLDLELALTAAHQGHAATAKVDRELDALRTQFPTILQPIAEGDLLAGRVRYPLVAFGPEPAGLGYVCREGDIRQVMAKFPMTAEKTAAVEAMLDYWKTRTTAALTRAAYPDWVSEALPTDAWTTESGAAFPLYRMAGTILDYGKLLEQGLPGLRRCAETMAANQPASAELARSMRGALEIIATSCAHYAAQARALAADCGEPARVAELTALAVALDALQTRAPQSFVEALQLFWIYVLHTGTWNYGRMDIYMGPFLVRDLDSGVLAEAEALRYLQSLWRLMKAYDNQYNNRLYIGGQGRVDEASADRFALLALEATRTVHLNQPQLSLRFHEGQNPKLMEVGLSVIGAGRTYPMLYNDDVNVPAVAKAFAVPESEAIHYTPYGCGEYVLEHRSVGSPNGVVNLLKHLELALHNGIDPNTGRRLGPATGEAASFRSIEDVWAAYRGQAEYSIRALAMQEKIEYAIAGQEAEWPLLSLLYDDCLARGRGIFDGGVRYLGGTIETYGNTNAADSLLAIEEAVFKRGWCSLPELVQVLDGNFEGREDLRRKLLSLPKYGNDDDVADAWALRVHDHICNTSAAQAEVVGLHSYLVVIINNWANVIFGWSSRASADGRRDREALANANNPSPGRDRNGATAFLNSLAKLDPSIHAGAVQNMKFSRELFTRQRPKLEALLDGYFDRGGSQAMITVVSPEDLQAAMRAPDQWGHLMVRMGGFSSRFIDLPPDAQKEVLERTLHA